MPSRSAQPLAAGAGPVTTTPPAHRRQRSNSLHQETKEREEATVSTAAGTAKASASSSKLPEAVIVVDPISSGAVLALLAQRRGYQVVALYSDGLEEELLTLVPAECKKGGLRFARVIKHKEGDLAGTVRAVQRLAEEEMSVKQILVGCESGVALGDALTHALAASASSSSKSSKSKAAPLFPFLAGGGGSGGGAVGNALELSEARRNKYLMGECVRRAGLRAARQLMTDRWADVPAFLEDLRREQPTGSLRVVLKPLSSAGSDGVYFASSEAEARQAFDTILSTKNVFGEPNTAVLLQEFLQGKEYVVDSISHRGQHRVTALWEYDKRPTNGAAFVYYGLRLFETADRRKEQALAAYAHKVLDALGIRDSFSHAEVMWLDDGSHGGEGQPCLVEVGARPHGGEGTFVRLTEQPVGYNQLSVALDLIDHPDRLASLPVIPPRLKAHAAEVCLVSRKAGRLLRHRLHEHMRVPSPATADASKEEEEEEEERTRPAPLPSLQAVELHVKVGEYIRKTVDMLSSPGSAILIHQDRATLERDYEAIHQMDLFCVDEEAEGEETDSSAHSQSSSDADESESSSSSPSSSLGQPDDEVGEEEDEM